MLWVIDVGNTNTVMGMYQGKKLRCDWRIHTDINTTEDEYNILVANLFTNSGISPKQITKIVISCVVPPIVGVLDSLCKKYFKIVPIWVDAKTNTNMPILYTNPKEVGADRIVNAVAAYEKYKQGLIIIDFGTGTTFDAISEKGEYLGGSICPGLIISAEALFKRASKLPKVELYTVPSKIIGKDTAASIQSGIMFGYAGLVDGIVKRMKKEMKIEVKVIATGGYASLFETISETIESVEPNLTLEGLRIIGEKIK